MKRYPRRALRGFTLIELMITVAIIGILASIAYPSYTQYVVRSNRSAAQSFMFQIANRQEQILLDTRAYRASDSALANPLSPMNLTAPTDLSGKYVFSVAVTSSTTAAPTYAVTATPQGSQAANDTKCGTLSLSSGGVKSPSTSGCW